MTSPDHPDHQRDCVPHAARRTQDPARGEKPEQQQLGPVEKLLKVAKDKEPRGDQNSKEEKDVSC